MDDGADSIAMRHLNGDAEYPPDFIILLLLLRNTRSFCAISWQRSVHMTSSIVARARGVPIARPEEGMCMHELIY